VKVTFVVQKLSIPCESERDYYSLTASLSRNDAVAELCSGMYIHKCHQHFLTSQRAELNRLNH
jgi:hypothetical protein